MSEPVLVFVNDRPVRVAAGISAGEAVTALDPELGARLGEGAAYLTDGRGIRLEPGLPVFPGAIFRAVVSARAAAGEADAHA